MRGYWRKEETEAVKIIPLPLVVFCISIEIPKYITDHGTPFNIVRTHILIASSAATN
jgi:hypothetical protein